jgi:hypothetical protein
MPDPNAAQKPTQDPAKAGAAPAAPATRDTP